MGGCIALELPFQRFATAHGQEQGTLFITQSLIELLAMYLGRSLVLNVPNTSILSVDTLDTDGRSHWFFV